MKKPILALLVLLFLLIFTCVYQKTDVLYAKTNDNPSSTLPTITLKPLPAVKNEPTEVKAQEKVTKVAITEDVAKEVIAAEDEIKITKSETEVVQKPVIKQETTPLTPPTPVQAQKKEIEEIDALMQALKDREVAFKNRDAFELYIQELINQALENRAIAISHQQKDIEEIDALMQALKDREVAFKNRDAFELYIQRLIKQALDNRTIAISHMNNEELHLIEIQKELIKDRDHAYDNIGQTNIPTSGE